MSTQDGLHTRPFLFPMGVKPAMPNGMTLITDGDAALASEDALQLVAALRSSRAALAQVRRWQVTAGGAVKQAMHPVGL